MSSVSLDELVPALESFYDVPDGVLYRLRQGQYDPAGIERLQSFLADIHVEEDASLPRRFVSLVWFIPTLMRYQFTRAQEKGGDIVALERQIGMLDDTIADILGWP